MKKVFALVLAAMMVVTMFAGCGGSSAPAADTNTVKIGLTGPLTGPAAVYGEAVNSIYADWSAENLATVNEFLKINYQEKWLAANG